MQFSTIGGLMFRKMTRIGYHFNSQPDKNRKNTFVNILEIKLQERFEILQKPFVVVAF